MIQGWLNELGLLSKMTIDHYWRGFQGLLNYVGQMFKRHQRKLSDRFFWRLKANQGYLLHNSWCMVQIYFFLCKWAHLTLYCNIMGYSFLLYPRNLNYYPQNLNSKVFQKRCFRYNETSRTKIDATFYLVFESGRIPAPATESAVRGATTKIWVKVREYFVILWTNDFLSLSATETHFKVRKF